MFVALTGKPCGVDYELKAFVADHIEDKPNKRNLVRLAIRKIMYAPSKLGEQPSIEVSKEFMMKPNKIYLEASLDKEVRILSSIEFIVIYKIKLNLHLPRLVSVVSSWRNDFCECSCSKQLE